MFTAIIPHDVAGDSISLPLQRHADLDTLDSLCFYAGRFYYNYLGAMEKGLGRIGTTFTGILSWA
jgi:hypothetical protein